MNDYRMSQHFRIMILIAVAALFLGAAPALASVCTLADHIRSANTNTAIGFCPAGTSHDIITLTGDITLDEPLPAIMGTITIRGGGHTISGAGKFRIFEVNGGRLTINSLTMTEGFSKEHGGALLLQNGAYLALLESTLRDNFATSGGGIATMDASNRLTVDRSSFIGNETEFGSDGGAILAEAGRVDISNSRFSENYGGFFAGAIKTRTQLNVSNTTFDQNSARVAGGVLHVGRGVTTLTHVTMVDNRGIEGDGPDAVFRTGGRVILRNSIIANSNKYDDCNGGIAESIGNLSLDVSCAERAGGDPMLGGAADSPAYYPLLDGSPAIDADDDRFCLATDQIGTPRPQGGGCDIGAFESTDAIAAEQSEPEVCPLPDQIAAANRDQAIGNCAAGNGADTIYLIRDFTLNGPLPRIATDITIEGNGHTISGQGYRYLIFLVDGGKLKINNLTLTKGKGAIKAVNGGDVYVNDSRFIDNFSSGGGGAILIRSRYSELVVNNSSFVGNQTKDSSTDGSGGAILSYGPSSMISNSSFVNNQAKYEGGAIDTSNTGRVDISNSAFVDNRSRRRGGAINTANGGRVSIANSSFISNNARYGGAFSNTGADTTITHVTMLENTAFIGSGVWMHEDYHNVKLRNSVIAGAPHRHPTDTYYTSCVGEFTQNTGNLIQDGSCPSAVGGEPLLDEITDSSTYVSLKEGSPAIDAADARFCTETDQLGNPRPQGGGCDIGAIEFKVAGPLRVVSATTEDAQRECTVTTTHNLNFRDGPNGNRIGLVPRESTLPAKAKAPGWFNVEYLGKSGWISADYVVTEGDCG